MLKTKKPAPSAKGAVVKKFKTKLDKTSDYIISSQPKLKKNLSNLRDTPGTYFVTGCAHAPFQNKKFYNSVFNYLAKEVKLQGIILAGDILDLNSLSSHDKGKIPLAGVTLSSEYKDASKFLNEIDSIGAKTIDYVYGNHESRYDRAMSDAENAKLGQALLSPVEGLKLVERGYNVYTDWKNDYIQIGKYLDVNHGEFCNVHTAKKTIDTYRKSTLYFHTHRYQIYVEGLTGGWNMGSGADFNAPVFGYATRAMKNSWVNACCIVHLDSQGFYHVQPLVFINDKLFINGKSY